MKSKYRAYLKSEEWAEKRDAVMERAGGICERCRAEAREVHHITYERVFDEDLCDLLALCRRCHENEHNGRAPWKRKKTRKRPKWSKVERAAIQSLKRRLLKARKA